MGLPLIQVDVVRCDGSAQQYEVGEPQGRGGFGDVYKGSLLTAAADDRTATVCSSLPLPSSYITRSNFIS